MTCKICGREIPDGAGVCPVCGASAAEAIEAQETQIKKPRRRGLPIVLTVCGLICVLAACIIVPRLWLLKLRPLAAYFDGLEAPLPVSGADVKFTANILGNDISATGGYELGGDLSDSLAQIKANWLGFDLELALADGHVAVSDGKSSLNLDVLFGVLAKLGVDMSGLVKDGAIDPAGLAGLLPDGSLPLNIGRLREAADFFKDSEAKDEAARLLKIFCLKNPGVLKAAVNITDDGEKISYSGNYSDLSEAALAFLDYGEKNASGGFKDRIQGLRALVEEGGGSGWDGDCVLTLEGGRLDFTGPAGQELSMTREGRYPGQASVEFGDGKKSFELTAGFEGGYVDELSLSSDNDGKKLGLDVELSGWNDPQFDRDAVRALVKGAAKLSPALFGLDKIF